MTNAITLIPFLLYGFLNSASTFKHHVNASQIRIDLRHPGPRVSPTLYGLFFEEINHAGDGGLYAEMVRNGSFEDADTPLGWSAQPGSTIALDRSEPLFSGGRTSLKIEGGGASTAGYWGLSVRNHKKYRLSFNARVLNPQPSLGLGLEILTPSLAVYLKNADGKIIAAGRPTDVTAG